MSVFHYRGPIRFNLDAPATLLWLRAAVLDWFAEGLVSDQATCSAPLPDCRAIPCHRWRGSCELMDAKAAEREL